MIRTGMKVKQRQLIFANRPAIVDSIQLDPVLDHMVKEGEFTQSQVDELRKMPFRFSRNSRFVDILLTKGSHNYNAFCDALKHTDQLELARAMEPGRWTGQDYSPAKLPPKKDAPVDTAPKKKWRPSTVSDKSPGTKRRELKEKYGSAESIPDVKLEEMKRKAKERELKEKAIATEKEKEKEKEKKTMKDVGVGRTPELTRKSLSLPPVEKSVATEKENKEMRDIGVGKSPQLTRKGLAMYPDEDDIEVEETKTKKIPKLERDVGVEAMEVDGPELKSKSKDVKTKSRIPERRSFVMKPASPPLEVDRKTPSPPPEVVLKPVHAPPDAVMTMPSPPPKIAKKTPSPAREVVMKTPSPPPKAEMKFPTPPPESELAFSPKTYGVEYDTPSSVKKSLPSKTLTKTPSPPPEVLLDEPKSPPRTPAVPTMEMEVEEEEDERPMTVGQLLDDRKRKAEEIRFKMQERKKSLKHEEELSTVKIATDLNSSSPETSSSSGSNSESGKSFERRLSEDTDEGVDVSTPQSPKRLPSAKIEEIGKLLGTSIRTKPPSPPTEERIPSPPPYRAPSPPMSPPKVRPVSPIMEAPSPPRIRTPSPPPRARTPSPPPKIRTPSPPPPARARTPSPPPKIRTPSPPPRARSPSPPPRARTPSPPPKVRTPSPCLPPPRSPSPPSVVKDTKLSNHIPSHVENDDDIVYGEVYGVEYELVEEETPGEVHLVQSNQPPPSPPPLRKDDAFLVSSTPQKSSVVLESAPDLNSAPPKQKEDDYGVIFDYPELVTLRNVPSTRVPPPEKPVVIREAPPVVKSTPPTLNSAPPPSKIDCGVIADYPKLTVRNGHVNHAPPPPPSVTNSSKRSTPESYISEDFPAMMEPAEYNALVAGTPTPPEPSPVTALPTGQKKKLGVSQDVYKSLNSLSDLRKNNGKERRRSRNTDSPPVISDQVYGRPIKVLPTTMDNITPEMEKQMKEAASRIAKSERLLQVMKSLSDRTLSHACQCETLEDAGDKDLAELVQTGTTVRPGGDILIDKLSDELQDLYKQRPGVFNKKPGPWYANVNTAMRDTYNTLVVHLVHMKASLNDLSKAMEEYKKDNQLKNAYLSKRKEGHPHKH